MAFQSPLKWPDHLKRTSNPARSRFKPVSEYAAAITLEKELERLGSRYPVVTVDLRIKNDGTPYANQRKPEDNGVAVYFELDGRHMVLACDRWDCISCNIHAVALTVEALRGIERWGSSDMLRQAFAGFEALPEPSQSKPWWEVLGVVQNAPMDDIRREFRRLVKKHHPDHGGDPEQFREIKFARQAAEAARAAKS